MPRVLAVVVVFLALVEVRAEAPGASWVAVTIVDPGGKSHRGLVNLYNCCSLQGGVVGPNERLPAMYAGLNSVEFKNGKAVVHTTDHDRSGRKATFVGDELVISAAPNNSVVFVDSDGEACRFRPVEKQIRSLTVHHGKWDGISPKPSKSVKRCSWASRS